MANTKPRQPLNLPPGFTEVPVSAEQWAVWRAQAEETAKFQSKFARAIDRAIGVSDGRIAPDWARKAPKRKPQVARAMKVLRELYPQGSVPADVQPKVVLGDVNATLEARGEKTVSRPTIKRARDQFNR
jgi:hypothetical protein